MEINNTSSQTNGFDSKDGYTPLRARSRSVLARSTRRLRYEAEVQAIRKEIGSLEEIRQSLRLTQRQIAELLFVDPSAWTRWTKSRVDEAAPPYVYRMLEWYLLIKKEHPALSSKFFERKSELQMGEEHRALIKSAVANEVRSVQAQLPRPSQMDQANPKLEQLEKELQIWKWTTFFAALAVIILSGILAFSMRPH